MSAATPNAMHSAETVEHYTPPAIVEAARATLGAIDLDPASCALANERVRAAVYFDRAVDGLSRSWGPLGPGLGARVFCNPPGGKVAGESVQKLWWRKGARAWALGEVDALIWIAFKVDFLQTTQVGAEPGDVLPLDGAICYPSRRLSYWTPGPGGALVEGKSPPHASAIVYLPSRKDPEGLVRFRRAFSPIGAVCWDVDRLASIGARS